MFNMLFMIIKNGGTEYTIKYAETGNINIAFTCIVETVILIPIQYLLMRFHEIALEKHRIFWKKIL